MTTANQQHWWWRGLGVLVILAALTLYGPSTDQSALAELVLPLIIGAAAVLVVQNLLAVLLAGALLAGIHANWDLSAWGGAPTADSWVENTAYPLVCIACLLGSLAILIKRFRQKIRATHEARWQRRRSS